MSVICVCDAVPDIISHSVYGSHKLGNRSGKNIRQWNTQNHGSISGLEHPSLIQNLWLDTDYTADSVEKRGSKHARHDY